MVPINRINQIVADLNAYRQGPMENEPAEVVAEFANRTFKTLLEQAAEFSSFENFGKPYLKAFRKQIVEYRGIVSLDYYHQFLKSLKAQFLLTDQQILYKMLLCAIERNEPAACDQFLNEYSACRGPLLVKLINELPLITKRLPHQLKKRRDVIKVLSQSEDLMLDPSSVSFSFLIDNGFNFNGRSNFILHPIKYAFQQNDISLIKLLAPHFNDYRFLFEPQLDSDVVHYFNHKGIQAHVDIVRMMEQLGLIIIGSTEEDFKRALKVKASVAAGTLWEKHGFDPNTKVEGVTLLELKLLSGDLAFVKVLLEPKNRVNVNSVMSNGETPLGYVLKRSLWDYLGECFLSAGADINFPDKNKKTLLAHAFDASKLELMDQLLQKGANQFDYRNSNGDTYFSWALRNNKLDFLQKLLVVYKCPPDIKNSRGETLLYLAYKAKNLKLTGQLLELGADVNARTNSGEGIIHAALRAGMVSGLTNRKKIPNLYFKTEAGITPLSLARTLQKETYEKLYSVLFPDLKGGLITPFFQVESLTAEQIDQIIDAGILVQEPLLLKQMEQWMGNPELFANAFAHYLHKRPQIEAAFWVAPLLELDMTHCAVKVKESDIPLAPQDIDIAELVKEFEKINMTERGKPGYVPREAMEKLKSFSELTLALSQYVNNVKKPPANDDDDDVVNPGVYYSSLHNLLRHLTLFCRKMDLQERAYVLRDLAEAATFCSTRRFNHPLEMYYCYSEEKPDRSLPVQYYRQLAQLRSNIINLMANSDTHHVMGITKAIGDKLNIPGMHLYTQFQDAYKVKKYAPAATEKQFMGYYDVYKMYQFALSFIKEQRRLENLQEEGNSTLVAWFQSTIPPTFKGGRFHALKQKSAQLDTLLKRRLETKQITEAEFAVGRKNLLKRNNIESANDKESFDYAVVRQEKDEFISEVVFEEDYQTLRLSGVLHFLHTMGVITSNNINLVLDIERKVKALEEHGGKKSKR